MHDANKHDEDVVALLLHTLPGGTPISSMYIKAGSKTDLCVDKEEGNLLILKASLHHDGFNIFPPLCGAVVLRQLNLETLIF